MGMERGMRLDNGRRAGQNFRRFERHGWRLAAAPPHRKNYMTGYDVLFVKRAEDLPPFFTKVGMLAYFHEISQAKARSLLREAVEAVGREGGMTYRLRNRAAEKLKGTVRDMVAAWVAAEARKLTVAIQKDQAEQDESHRLATSLR